MSKRRRQILRSIGFMTGLSFLAAVVTVLLFYELAIREQRNKLSAIVQSQTRLIEAIVSKNEQSGLTDDQLAARTLAELRAVYNRWEGFGATSEFLIAERRGEEIHFLLALRNGREIGPDPIPFPQRDGDPGDAIRWGLFGRTDTLSGADYRGQQVLAACTPFMRFRWGVVAQVDLAEIRAPFVQAALLAGGAAVVVILFGVAVISLTTPVISKLEESEVHARDIVDHASDGIVTIDAEGRILAFNASAEKMFGYTAQEAIGRNITTLMPAPEALTDDPLAPFRPGGDPQVVGGARESRGMRRNGAIFPVSVSLSEVRYGELRSYTAILRDISRQKADEQALRDYAAVLEQTNRALEQSMLAAQAATQAKSEFLANMSHEIRTPVNAILGLSELALTSGAPQGDGEYLQTIRGSARSLLRLINDILDFSKIEARQMHLERTTFSLPSLVEQTLRLESLPAERKNLTLSADIAGDVPEALWGDPLRLRQVLLNLVDNAVKFTPQGSVTVSIRRASDEAASSPPAFGEGEITLEFVIRDTGIGIPPDKQSLVFEVFTQADGSTTRKYGGAGLGLAFASKLVKLFGGRIWVESPPEGGTAMHFTARFAPAAADAAAATLSEPAAWERDDRTENGARPGGLAPPSRGDAAKDDDLPTQPSAHPARILLAEDNLVNQRVAAEWLKRWGHQVQVVNNGQAAIDAWAGREEPFALALMDVQMPGVDGLAATAEIRQREQAANRPRMPIIALTAHALPTDRDRCLAAGMDEYLAKPLRPRALFDLIESMLAGGNGDSRDAGPPAESPVEPLDRAAALRHCGGNAAVLADIAQIFLAESPRLIHEIHSALAAEDSQGCSHAAHQLKGSVSNFFASATVTAARQVEEAARRGDFPTARDACVALDRELARLKPALAELTPAPVA
jgi:PAS domain S-box-containing protein